MASTIKLKNGSGAPLASDLVQGEPALDLTNKRLYTEDSLGAVIEVGTNPTELQVDNINIDGNAITSTDTDGNITITPNGTGEVDISKVDIDSGAIDNTVIGGTTTAAGSFTTLQADTSLNVDGTVTADGLTVDTDGIVYDSGNVGIGTSSPFSINGTNLEVSDALYARVILDSTAGTRYSIQSLNDSSLGIYDLDADTERMRIANNGDISFYEDTGTTAKFFWDASAEQLAIGSNINSVTPFTISADTGVGVASAFIRSTGTDNNGIVVDVTNTPNNYIADFRIGNTSKMRIDSSGNVGIGTDSPFGTSVLTVTNDTDEFQAITVLGADSTSEYIAMGVAGAGESRITAGGVGSTSNALTFHTSSSGVESEAVRIDATGNLMVSLTDTFPASPGDTDAGVVLRADGRLITNVASDSHYFNLTGSDGEIIEFRKDGSPVGSIGSNSGNMYITSVDVGLLFNSGGNQILPAASTDISDATKDLGSSSARFKDLYLSGQILLGTTSAIGKLRSPNAISIADDSSVTLSASIAGGYLVTIYDSASGSGAVAFITYPGAPIILAQSGFTFSTSDTDGNFCILKSTYSHNATFKNRIGGTRSFNITILGGNAV